MIVALLTAALAADRVPVGFSALGNLYTWAEVTPTATGAHARVYTLDVARSTWNHFPVEADGADAAAAVRAALAAVKPGYAATEALPGVALGLLREGGRDHTHDGPHRTTWSVRLGDGPGRVALVEAPSTACAGAVEPWLALQRDGGSEVQLLADRNPRRWPACALTWELSEVLQGPRGALVLVLRSVWMVGDRVEIGWTAAGAR